VWTVYDSSTHRQLADETTQTHFDDTDADFGERVSMRRERQTRAVDVVILKLHWFRLSYNLLNCRNQWSWGLSGRRRSSADLTTTV